jgi:hypothetical protein
MALSIRNQILDVLATALAGITVAGGYSVDVQRVLRRPSYAADLQPNMPHPTVFLWSDRDVHLPEAPETALGQVMHELALSASMVTYAEEDRLDEIGGELAADLEQALTTANGMEVAGAVVDVVPLAAEVLSGAPVGIAGAGVLFRLRFSTPLALPRVPG